MCGVGWQLAPEVRSDGQKEFGSGGRNVAPHICPGKADLQGGGKETPPPRPHTQLQLLPHTRNQGESSALADPGILKRMPPPPSPTTHIAERQEVSQGGRRGISKHPPRIPHQEQLGGGVLTPSTPTLWRCIKGGPG
uniref:Uncharacterized protein n=1 Tax=Sphaerodactylus townsendi TaxID=933632 RepID=A0ACB8FLZ4_9SAUR